ncbi:ABC transporter ATP-binding protein [Microvirga roseola]|uniref:ABC transporter ATP-binding protein n=1 Tax=Microvirga roseola TaxID=2883126 RepID=UPI001E55B485|nr:ABC transporter ATP-binding protein [Microvirga roseola]
MSLTEAIVVLERAELSYPSPEGEVSVLNGIDLKVRAGEILAVTGPSGSGKSSLIAIMGGLEQVTGGRAAVLGTDLGTASEAARTRLRRDSIGVVFQAYHLVPAMTALENVALPLVLARAPDAHERSAAMLEAMGLRHRVGHRPAALSGGEQQRVAIARAFVSRPRLILADEPTGNLDQRTGEGIVSAMFEMARTAGTALVLVTHDAKLAGACDRRIEIEAGSIRRDSGIPKEEGALHAGVPARAN